ncbi:hypothetical protein Tco_1027081 [Tanacetum coccineum]
MDPYNHSTPTSTKLPILDTRKFEQWKFRIQQYLQHEHYALWEVIEFGDSYKSPPKETSKGVTGEGSGSSCASCVREVTNVIIAVQIECSPSCMIKAIDFLSLFLDEWDDWRLPRRYGLGLILYRAPCAIKGVLSLDLSKVTITLQAKALDLSLGTTSEIDPYNHSTPTSTKLPILDTRKFEQWKFRIQQYLQHEHYTLWEVIEFGDSYKAPLEETGKGVTSEGSAKKKGRTVAITTKDMQKRRNDVKARTTVLLALPYEHQLRFSKYDNAK